MKKSKTLYDLLKGKFLVSEDSAGNWSMILFVSFLALIMISSSHRADKKVYKIAQLTEEIKELRSIMFEGRSKLMKLKMETTMIERMEKRGLELPKIPPQKIIVQ